MEELEGDPVGLGALQHVIPIPPVQDVVAAEADQVIASVAAEEVVVVHAAANRVAKTTPDHVLDVLQGVATVAVGRSEFEIDRDLLGRRLERHHVEAAVPIEVVLPGAPSQEVVVSSTLEEVVASQPVESIVSSMATEVVRRLVADEDVVELAALEILHPKDGVGAIHVAAESCTQVDDHSRPGIGVVDHVDTRATIEDIIATESLHDVVACTAGDHIRGIVAVDVVIEGRTDDVLHGVEFVDLLASGGPRRTRDGLPLDQIDADRSRGFREDGRVRSTAAHQDVVAPTAGQHIPASAAIEVVGAVVASQTITPVGPEDVLDAIEGVHIVTVPRGTKRQVCHDPPARSGIGNGVDACAAPQIIAPRSPCQRVVRHPRRRADRRRPSQRVNCLRDHRSQVVPATTVDGVDAPTPINHMQAEDTNDAGLAGPVATMTPERPPHPSSVSKKS